MTLSHKLIHTLTRFCDGVVLSFLPVVPVITLITADHRTAIIRFITAGADPDLITPLITNLWDTNTHTHSLATQKIKSKTTKKVESSQP